MAASPWAKLEQVESVTFEEIMSEEYARQLQNEENNKFAKLMVDRTIPEGVSAATGTGTEASSEKKLVEEVTTLNDNLPYGLGDFYDSDRLIAEMLQAQFDVDHDDELKRIEQARNKDAKVQISYSKYRNVPEELIYDSESESDDFFPPKNWDRFEENEKKIDVLPKRGFTVNESGERLTKHNEKLCGVRNACRVMSFPPEIKTGDAAGFDMQLSNQVFNQLKMHSHKRRKTPKANDQRENVATAEHGVDAKCRLILYKLINNKVLSGVNGIISTGKESIILHAFGDKDYVGELNVPKECAIKVFTTTLNEFKQRDRYIKDDFRFKDRFRKQNNRAVINMWAEKEMHNLMRLKKAGIFCPEVITLKKQVLVMSFIGNNGVAAPKLKHATNISNIFDVYTDICAIMKQMYKEANLIHADLSEYNILWHNNRLWIIDVAQSVTREHPSALEFLMRDCNNIVTYFNRCGLKRICTKEELFHSVCGLDPSAHTASMLERIHNTKGPSERIATACSQDDVPDEYKCISYPFDTAWEKSKESPTDNNEICPPDVHKIVVDGPECIPVVST